jgi:hypothetical protein
VLAFVYYNETNQKQSEERRKTRKTTVGGSKIEAQAEKKFQSIFVSF